MLSMAAKHFFEKRHGKRFRPTVVALMGEHGIVAVLYKAMLVQENNYRSVRATVKHASSRLSIVAFMGLRDFSLEHKAPMFYLNGMGVDRWYNGLKATVVRTPAAVNKFLFSVTI